MVKTGRSISLDTNLWNEISEHAKKISKDISASCEDLIRKGLEVSKKKSEVSK